MLPWFTKYPNQNDEILNLDWVIKQVENLKAAFEAFLAANSLTFADPILWDITKQYSKNTIVLSPEGDAYLSKKVVGAGIPLNNTDYWLEIFNFAEYVRTANSNLTMNIELNIKRASKNYNVNDWLIWDDILYKVTVAISSDDLFVIDQNIERFTVEDFCRAWVSYGNSLITQYKNEIDASELAFVNGINATVLQYKNDIDASELDFTTRLEAAFDQVLAGATVDSEVINARVGANGITYTTLGNAIRGQFDEIRRYNVVLPIPVVKDNQWLDITRARISNSYLDYTTGKIAAATNYAVSDYFPIKESTDYYTTLYVSGASLCFYNVNLEFISGINMTTGSFTTPAGAAYIRYSSLESYYQNNAYCNELGVTPTGFHSYEFLGYESTVDISVISDGSIPTSKLQDTTYEYGVNLFNGEGDEDTYVDYQTGITYPAAPYFTTEYIAIKPNRKYTQNHTPAGAGQLAFYDQNKSYISGILFTSGGSQSFITPAGAAYLKTTFLKWYLSSFALSLGDEAIDGSYSERLIISPDVLPSKNYILVSKDGKGDYGTVTEAVAAAFSGDIIFIKAGIYDNEEIKAWGKNVSIIGEDRERVIIKNGYNTYTKAPLEMASGTLKNVTVLSYYNNTPSTDANGWRSYAIHIDNDSLEDNSINIENCNLISENNCALGIGLRKNGKIIFDNCYIKSTILYPIFCHGVTDSADAGDEFISFNKCTVHSEVRNQIIRLSSYQIEGENINIKFNNNTMVSDTIDPPTMLLENQPVGEATTVGTFYNMINVYQNLESRNNYPSSLNYQ